MSPVTMFAEPRPVTIATIAILALALVATLALSRVIKRREAARAAAAALVPRPAIQAERLQRAISPAVPQDVQERLRFLTTGIDRAPGHAPLNGGGQGTAADRERPGSAAPRAGIGVPDDATRYFGDASSLTPLRGGPGDGATTFFGHGLESGVNDDATRFFGDVDAGDFFGEEPQPATAPGEQDDATRFFGAVDEGDASLLASGTQFFSPDV